MLQTANLIKMIISQGDEDDKNLEEDNYRLKMASMPDPTVYPSTSIRELLDMRELPKYLKEKAWRMLEEHTKVFGFDGWLGDYPAKARIRTKENVQPISLPMYALSPVKREVIDKQIDTWLA